MFAWNVGFKIHRKQFASILMCRILKDNIIWGLHGHWVIEMGSCQIHPLLSTMNRNDRNEIIVVVPHPFCSSNDKWRASIVGHCCPLSFVSQLQLRFQYGRNQLYKNHLNDQEIISSSPFCSVSLHDCKCIDWCIFQQNPYHSHKRT